MKYPIRVVLSEDRPDTILVHVGYQETDPLVLPPIPVPFDRSNVATTLRAAGVAYTILDPATGTFHAASDTARYIEKNTRKVQAQLRAAGEATILRGSVDPIERDRAALIKQRLDTDTKLAEIKDKLRSAKAAAFTGTYMDPAEFAKLESEVGQYKILSQGILFRLGQLKREQSAASARTHRTHAENFVKCAYRTLDAAMLERIDEMACLLDEPDRGE